MIWETDLKHGLQDSEMEHFKSMINRTKSWKRVVGGVSMLAIVFATVGTVSASEIAWSPPTPAEFAAGVQNASPEDRFTDVSCASEGNCTAVGWYKLSSGSKGALIMSSSNGVWGEATVVDTSSRLYSVSCASAGNCTAVGQLGLRAATMTSTDGTWGQLTEVTFPSDDFGSSQSESNAKSVSCSSAGNCAVVGYFTIPGSYPTPQTQQAFAMMSTSGTWSAPSKPVFADDARPAGTFNYDQFTSVSCASDGDCTAVGAFQTNDGQASPYVSYKEPFTMTSTNGMWAQASVADFSGVSGKVGSGDSKFTAVSCASAGNCTAVGEYYVQGSNGQAQARAFTMTSDSWSWDAPRPSSTSQSRWYSVSCASADNCLVGGLSVVTPIQAVTTLSMRDGVWDTGIRRQTVFEGSTSNVSEVASVSCGTADSCVVVGRYDANGGYMPFVMSMSAGTWSDATKPLFPESVVSNDYKGEFYSVSCVGAGNCAAVGEFRNGNGSQKEAFAMIAPAPLVAPVAPNAPTDSAAPPGPLPKADGSYMSTDPSASSGDFFLNQDGTTQSGIKDFVAGEYIEIIAATNPETDIALRLDAPPDSGQSNVSAIGVLTYEAGGTGRATGRGFKPGTTAVLYLFSDPLFLGSTTVQSDGTWEKVFDVPADIAPGPHTIQAQGVLPDGSIRAVIAGVMVTAPAASAVTVPALPGLVWLLILLVGGLGVRSRMG